MRSHATVRHATTTHATQKTAAAALHDWLGTCIRPGVTDYVIESMRRARVRLLTKERGAALASSAGVPTAPSATLPEPKSKGGYHLLNLLRSCRNLNYRPCAHQEASTPTPSES